MELDQIIDLKKKLKKNNTYAFEFVQRLELALTEFDKTRNFSNTCSDIKKAILVYGDKLLNQKP